MAQNGIRFEIIDENTAEKFLSDKNFFFKLKAFDKNFEKYEDVNHPQYGKYINLDFAFLVDLSRKDALLRELILDIALDLEHYMKVSVNRTLMRAKIETRPLIEEFFIFSREKSLARLKEKLDIKEASAQVALIKRTAGELELFRDNDIEQIAPLISSLYDMSCNLACGIDCNYAERSLSHLGTSTYSKDLFEKYGNPGQMEPWHFMEMASFGEFISFYKFLFFDSSVRSIVSLSEVAREDLYSAKKIKNLLFPAKMLRNAAAHNDCLLNTLSKKTKKPLSPLRTSLESLDNLDITLLDSVLKTNLVYDFASLLICYDKIVPLGGTKSNAALKLESMGRALQENTMYYEQCNTVKRPLELLAALTCSYARYWSEMD